MSTSISSTARITVRPSNERGHTDFGWLDSRHTFSFGHYLDEEHVAFRSLRVINEDRVSPGGGFPMHQHRDMEILSYVVSGELQHRDSMGNGGIVRAGELQAMSAGQGIYHSEANASPDQPVHFFQVWIMPAQRGLQPSYSEWKPASDAAPVDTGLTLLASNGGQAGVTIHQDARLYLGAVEAGSRLEYDIAPSRGVWLQVFEGSVEVLGKTLGEGDGAAIEEAELLEINAQSKSRFLLFDLA